jgi:hypothetical protein
MAAPSWPIVSRICAVTGANSLWVIISVRLLRFFMSHPFFPILNFNFYASQTRFAGERLFLQTRLPQSPYKPQTR